MRAPFLAFLILAAPAWASIQVTNWFREFSGRTHEQTGFVLGNDLVVARNDAPTAATWLLDFESPLPEGSKGLLLLEDASPFGKAAWFRTPANALTVPAPAWGPFLGKSDTPDFTLRLRFRVDATAAEAKLLVRECTRYLPKEGRAVNQALRVVVRRGCLTVEMENLLRRRNGESSLVLSMDETLEPRRWYVLSLRHDLDKARLDLDLDGKTVASAETRNEAGDRYGFGFFPGTAGPLVLGTGLLGALDEVRLDRGQKVPVAASPWPDGVSHWTSLPITLKPFSRLVRVDVSPPSIQPQVQAEMRLYPEFFLADDPERPWQRVPLGREDAMPNLGTGRYAQVRLHLRTQKGLNPGRIEAIALVSESTETPEPPLLLDVKPKPGGAEISWQVSTDEKIVAWRLWWLPQGEALNRRNAKSITVKKSELNLGNEAVDSRAVWRMAGLEDGLRYVVAITALDERGPAMESGFSRKMEVTPDPFAP